MRTEYVRRGNQRTWNRHCGELGFQAFVIASIFCASLSNCAWASAGFCCDCPVAVLLSRLPVPNCDCAGLPNALVERVLVLRLLDGAGLLLVLKREPEVDEKSDEPVFVGLLVLVDPKRDPPVLVEPKREFVPVAGALEPNSEGCCCCCCCC